jgi:hypothetical protein
VAEIHDHPLLQRQGPVLHELRFCGKRGSQFQAGIVCQDKAPVELLCLNPLERKPDPVAGDSTVSIIVMLLDRPDPCYLFRRQGLQGVVLPYRTRGNAPGDNGPDSFYIEGVIDRDCPPARCAGFRGLLWEGCRFSEQGFPECVRIPGKST